MYELSFDLHDCYISLPGNRAIAIRLLGEHTLYVPDPANIQMVQAEKGGTFHTTSLMVAGTKTVCEGSLTVKWVYCDDDVVQLFVTATLPEPCRSVVYLLDGIDVERVDYIALESPRQVADAGFVKRQIRPINYPRFSKMPLWFAATSRQEEYYFLWYTDQVESKNFGSYYSHFRSSQLTVLSHHQRRSCKNCTIETPALEFGPCLDRMQVIEKRLTYLEQAGIITPYQLRIDKPSWLDHIRLTMHLHGQHWSGFIHNTFDDMRNAVETLSPEIEPQSVLCIVLGWDGPYYRSALNIFPSAQLGGERAFLGLKQTISQFGGKLIVFAPLCVVERRIVEEMGWQEGILRRPWGAEAWCDWSDWNGDLENEPAVFMNMGYAPYRDHLIAKYTYLVEQCGIDGIYFDITNYWEDDPSHDHLAGVRTLIDSLHAIKANLLICAENWYDHLLGIFPLFGEPGNIMGPNDLLLRYCRSIAYIACPSPLGSGGVHEKGRNYMGASTLKEVNIPHLTVTEDWRLCIEELCTIARQAMRWPPSGLMEQH